MKVHYGLDNIPNIKHPVVTSGTFDGVHLGHRTILTRLKEIANNIDGETVVITFWPHPRFVLSNYTASLKLLSTIDEKIKLMNDQHIDHLIIIPFTKEFSATSSNDFIESILINKIHTQKLVIGYDHRFGKNREGSFEYLTTHQEQFNFQIEEIPRKDIDNLGISSTAIRNHLENGNVHLATEYLGEPYFVTGKVVIGKQNGRKIGFPTANIDILDKNKLIPSDGVYAVQIQKDDVIFNGMMNIGYRPTLNGNIKSLEVHIFEFTNEIYGEILQIHFIKRIRDEIKFENMAELKDRLTLDKQEAQTHINAQNIN